MFPSQYRATFRSKDTVTDEFGQTVTVDRYYYGARSPILPYNGNGMYLYLVCRNFRIGWPVM